MPAVRRINLSYVLRLALLLCIFTAVKNQKIGDDDTSEKKNLTETSHKPKLHDEVACPSGVECFKLGSPCIKCDYNVTCVYGNEVNVTCHTHSTVNCTGSTTFERTMICRYCYQTDASEHTCIKSANCNSVSSPRAYYRTNCTVHSEVLCLGNRRFFKNLPCNWTGGYRWSTALLLSITLGGFGADRFYLGHWQEGIGKLFSFGGLGVWTLVDVVLIWLHYLGPADGSLYI